MDLTNFVGLPNNFNKAKQPSVPVTTAKPISSGAAVNMSEFKNEDNPIKKAHWSITGAIEEGQIAAGEVDDEQKEFLKNTEWTE